MARLHHLIRLVWVPLVALVFSITTQPSTALAQSGGLPPNFSVSVVTGGLNNATKMFMAPGNRIFIGQQEGVLRVVQNGVLLAQPFVTIANVDSSYERGLLGVTVDPDFPTTPYVYVFYSTTIPFPHYRVSRFTADAGANYNVAIAGSEIVLFDMLEPITGTSHHGGPLRFGPDGKLYIAFGDDFVWPTDPAHPSQKLDSLRGKLLRINADGSIPTNNPFYSLTTDNNRAIYALGLRSPFGLAVDQITGAIYVHDVGWNDWEEVNPVFSGANYGWPELEGPTTSPPTYPPPQTYYNPVIAYPHDLPGTDGGCAVAAGTFYNPPVANFPTEYIGDYFYADFCRNYIRQYDPITTAVTDFATTPPGWSLVDMGTGGDGALYYLSRGNNSLYRITYAPNQPPAITLNPQPQTVAENQPATFTCGASSQGTLTYQWQQSSNGVDYTNITGASSTLYRIQAAALAQNALRFRCVATNSNGSTNSLAAQLTVLAGQAPTPTIVTPTAGTLYNLGDTINYSGSGVDNEDGTLPASAFTWWVDMYHSAAGGLHSHPVQIPVSGVTSGSFTVEAVPHADDYIWYRIYLRVTDSVGLTTTTYRDILPAFVAIPPEIEVEAPGGIALVDGGIYNLGTTTVGTPLSRVLTVRNQGSQPLNLLTNPPLVTGMFRSTAFGLTTLTTSRTTTFTLTCSALTAGSPVVGTLYFGTNDLDENPFNVTVLCTVVSPPSNAPLRNLFTTPLPKLTWGRVPWATLYEVQVSQSSTFAGTPRFSQTLSPDTLEVTVNPPLADGLYYWRMRARREDGVNWGPWSAGDTFVVDTP